MSELEDKINSILNSPEEMSRITQLAKSLMGGGPGDAAGAGGDPPGGGLDPDLLSKLSGMLGGMSGGGAGAGAGGNDKLALIQAMGPFLGEKRRRKMTRALQIARAAKLAGILFAEKEGDGDL